MLYSELLTFLCSDTNNGRSQVDESMDTATPMDEDGDHVSISDDEGEEDEAEEVHPHQPSSRKLTSKV